MRRIIVSTFVVLTAATALPAAAAAATVTFRGTDSGTFVALPPGERRAAAPHRAAQVPQQRLTAPCTSSSFGRGTTRAER